MANDEATARPERIRIEQHGSAGLLWIAAWLFTIGVVHPGFWRGALALLLWPYYLGSHVTTMIGQ